MATGVINEFTLIDEAKLFLNDYGATWFGDDATEKYRGFLLDHVLGDEQTYTLTKRATGLWTYSTRPSPVAVICSSDPQFTREDDVTYRLYAKGLKVVQTAGSGTPTATEIEILATPVDYREATAELLEFLSAHKAQIDDENIGGASISGGEAASRLLNAAAHIRGPMGI